MSATWPGGGSGPAPEVIVALVSRVTALETTVEMLDQSLFQYGIVGQQVPPGYELRGDQLTIFGRVEIPPEAWSPGPGPGQYWAPGALGLPEACRSTAHRTFSGGGNRIGVQASCSIIRVATQTQYGSGTCIVLYIDTEGSVTLSPIVADAAPDEAVQVSLDTVFYSVVVPSP